MLDFCSAMLLVLHNTKKKPIRFRTKFHTKGKINNAFLNKYETIDNARIKSFKHYWYVPHYTPSIFLQCIISKQNSRKTRTELQYIEKIVFPKNENDQNLWTFEIRSEQRIIVLLSNVYGFQQRDRQSSPTLNIDAFCRLQVLTAECITGTEKNSDAGI